MIQTGCLSIWQTRKGIALLIIVYIDINQVKMARKCYFRTVSQKRKCMSISSVSFLNSLNRFLSESASFLANRSHVPVVEKKSFQCKSSSIHIAHTYLSCTPFQKRKSISAYLHFYSGLWKCVQTGRDHCWLGVPSQSLLWLPDRASLIEGDNCVNGPSPCTHFRSWSNIFPDNWDPKAVSAHAKKGVVCTLLLHVLVLPPLLLWRKEQVLTQS